MSEFEAFDKIPRLNREMIVTEKIDGTNASVLVPDDDGPLLVGSRNRWITPDDDNYGFARYVAEHEDTFRQLGPGRHFGEWWGQGVARKYGLDHKRFSLFNTSRWNTETVPDGLHVVPVLSFGHTFSTRLVSNILEWLREHGSQAAPGFMRPEGVIVWHVAARTYFKATIERDAEWKGKGS